MLKEKQLSCLSTQQQDSHMGESPLTASVLHLMLNSVYQAFQHQLRDILNSKEELSQNSDVSIVLSYACHNNIYSIFTITWGIKKWGAKTHNFVGQ